MTRMINGLKRGQSAKVARDTLVNIFARAGLKQVPAWVELSDGRKLSIRRESGEFYKIVLL